MSNCGELYPCVDCPFRGPQVGSKGDPNSPFLIIGESPGKQELIAKSPFVGPSGHLLEQALQKAGLTIEPYYINAMQCWPGKRDDKDETILQRATTACRHHVLDEIRKAPRKVILSLGSSAIWSITGSFEHKITRTRGKLHTSEYASIGVIPSVHPAFLMSGGTGVSTQQFMRDVQYAVDLLHGKPAKKPPIVKYTIASSVAELDAYAKQLSPADYVGSDIETSGFQAVRDRILSVGFAVEPSHVFVVPEELVLHTKSILESPAKFIWHHGQFDVKFFRYRGINARVDEDTILLSYALDEIGGIHNLEIVSSDWLDSPNWKDMLESHLETKSASYATIPPHILHEYMAYDIGNMRAVFDELRPRVAGDKHLEKLYTKVLIPATNFLANVELNGIYIDRQRVEENEASYAATVHKYGQELFELANQFPDSGYTDKLPNSPKQLQKLIYDDLRFKPFKGTRSTNKQAMESWPNHPIVQILKKYRKAAKERGTYVTPFYGRINKQSKQFECAIQHDGRVHASLSLFKTTTGRLASSDPNIQNIPRNPQIRGQFVATPGRRFIEVDLNQAELRILATLSRDPELCRIYLTEGMSLHDEVRATIWGYPKDYTPEMLRQQLEKYNLAEAIRYDEHGKDLLIAEQKMRAKAVNFGVIYGITGGGLAEQTGSSVADAAAWIDAWFNKFKVASKFIDQCKNAPILGQTLITPFGRKRRPGIVSGERLRDIQNQFANFPEQSAASDCTLTAAILLEAELKQKDSIIVNLIHDALLIEAPDDDDVCADVAAHTIRVMQEVPKMWGFNVIPFVAEAKQGYRWGSLKGD